MKRLSGHPIRSVTHPKLLEQPEIDLLVSGRFYEGRRTSEPWFDSERPPLPGPDRAAQSGSQLDRDLCCLTREGEGVSEKWE